MSGSCGRHRQRRQLLQTRLDHTAAILGQFDIAQTAEAKARDAPAGRHQRPATYPQAWVTQGIAAA